MVRPVALEAEGISVRFDATLGLVESLTVSDSGAEIAPLHRAPWVGTDEPMPGGAAPHLARLGGDFFCAPFGGHEGDSPLHGWPPNTAWEVTRAGGARLVARLSRKVMGAGLIKELTLRPGHPFLYQQHRFRGGDGALPVANHANLSLPNGGLLRFSPKSLWMTPPEPQESDPARGRSGLRYPAQGDDPTRFPAAGGVADLTRYPWFPAHEDFVAGIEAVGHLLGWTAVTRPAEGDLFLSLRDARALPMTMLWHSNGGRDYAPWSGRHRGCLGIEEGAAAPILGSGRDVPLAAPGTLRLNPGGAASVRHVIGALRWPSGDAVRSVVSKGDMLTITGEDGGERRVPFDGSFLTGTLG